MNRCVLLFEAFLEKGQLLLSSGAAVLSCHFRPATLLLSRGTTCNHLPAHHLYPRAAAGMSSSFCMCFATWTLSNNVKEAGGASHTTIYSNLQQMHPLPARMHPRRKMHRKGKSGCTYNAI
eukprot:2888258-Amphidinium_carterae.1